MDIDEIKSTVQNELERITENKEEISKNLIEPTKEHFTTMGGAEQESWIIGKKDEYFLVFHEDKMSFGLAFRNITKDLVYLGDEGSLADAYEALISRQEPSGKDATRSSRPFGRKKRH